MEVKIIKVGSSKGIRIPAKILKEFNCPDSFNLNITDYGIFLKPIKSVREGWREAYIKSNSGMLDDKIKGKNT